MLVTSFVNLETYLNLEFETGKSVIDIDRAADNSIESHLTQPFQTAADFKEDGDVKLVQETNVREQKADRPSLSSVDVSEIKPNDQTLSEYTSEVCHKKPQMSKIEMGPSFLATGDDDDALCIDDEGNQLITQLIVTTSVPDNQTLIGGVNSLKITV